MSKKLKNFTLFSMKDAIEMYNKYGDETLYPLDFMYTDVELAIKEAE